MTKLIHSTRSFLTIPASLLSLTAILALAWSFNLQARLAPPAAELEDQILKPDEMFSWVIGRDRGDDTTLLTIEGLPEDAVLLENLNGSSTVLWLPGKKDIGEHDLVVHRADFDSPQLTVEQPVRLIVASSQDYQRLRSEHLAARAATAAAELSRQKPESVLIISSSTENKSQYRRKLLEPGTAAAASARVIDRLIKGTAAEPGGPVYTDSSRTQGQQLKLAQTPPVPAGAVPQTRVIPAATNGGIDKLATVQPLAEPGMIGHKPIAGESGAGTVPPTQTLVAVDSRRHTGRQSAAPVPKESAGSKPLNISLNVAREFNLTSGRAFSQEFGYSANTDEVLSIRTLNMPTGSSISPIGKQAYVFEWLPESDDEGQHTLIFQIRDKKQKVVLSHRIRLKVSPP